MDGGDLGERRLMHRRHRAILDSRGQPLAGVSVRVDIAGTGTLAPIYSDVFGVTPKSNPFTNDANGSYEYYARTGRYSETFTKTGSTFEATDTADLLFVDPLSLDAYQATWGSDFASVHDLSSSRIVVDGGLNFATQATVGAKTPTTTFRNGWLQVVGSGASAPFIQQVNGPGTFYAPWVITADPMVLEFRVIKESGSATTLRVGLGSASLSAGDPAHGFYVRQVDSNNAFLVVRSGGADSGTVDLGVTLASARKIRIVARNAGIRAFVDDVATTEVTASIPSAQILGFSAAGSATGSGIGLALDYVRIWSPR